MLVLVVLSVAVRFNSFNVGFGGFKCGCAHFSLGGFRALFVRKGLRCLELDFSKEEWDPLPVIRMFREWLRPRIGFALKTVSDIGSGQHQNLTVTNPLGKTSHLWIKRHDVIMLAPKPPLQSNNTWTRVLLCWTYASCWRFGTKCWSPHTKTKAPESFPSCTFPNVHAKPWDNNTSVRKNQGRSPQKTKKTCSCKNWFHWAGTDMALPQHQYNNNN